MFITTPIKFTSHTISQVIPAFKNYESNLMVGFKTINYTVNNLNSFYDGDLTQPKNDVIYTPTFTGNGSFSGGSYEKTVDEPYESEVTLYYNDIVVDRKYTLNGLFKFDLINENLFYNIKSKPLSSNNLYPSQVFENIKPVTNSSFYFDVICNYSKQYTKANKIVFYTTVIDPSGIVEFTLSNAPIGVTVNIDGIVVCENLSLGKYDFTLNCKDINLNITKYIRFVFDIV